MSETYHMTSAKIRQRILDQYKAAGETVGEEDQETIDIAVHAATSAIETVFRISSAAEDFPVTAALALSVLYAEAFDLAAQGTVSILRSCNQGLH